MKFKIALGIRERNMQPYQIQLARIALSIFTLVSMSTGAIYASKHVVNPQIPD